MSEDGDRVLNLVGGLLVVAVIGSLALLVLVGMDAPASPAGPETDWTLERINDTHVRIVHAGGDPVDASELKATVDGRARPVSWSGRITEGDAGVVRARSGAQRLVRLYWVGGRADRELLERWRLPRTSPASPNGQRSPLPSATM